jgi:hypothetical protein
LASALASSMALVSVIIKAATGVALFGGPFVSIIGVVGSILVVSGLIISEIMKLNPNEKFSALSFLGEFYDKAPKEIFWSNVKLPVKNADYITEAKVLLQLLANFKLEITKDTLTIYPSLYYENSVFYVELEFQIYKHPVLEKLDGKDTVTGGRYVKKYAKIIFDFSSHSLEQTNIDDKNIYRVYTSPDVYNDVGQKITDIKNRVAKIDIALNQAGEAVGGYDKNSEAFNIKDVKFENHDDEEVHHITANVYLELESIEQEVYIPKKIKEKDTKQTFTQAIKIVWKRGNDKKSEFSLNKNKIIKLG